MTTPNTTQGLPVREDLTGKWSHTSFLLDPTSSALGEEKDAMQKSIAWIWAQGHWT